MAIKFKEIKQYIARNVKLSICFEDGFYNNYLLISDVPESKYDEFYVYGIGMVNVEFSRDVYLKSDDPDGVCFTSKNMTLEAALEIALCKKPREVERKTNKGLAFQDLKAYLQVFGTLAIVCEEDYKEELYEFREKISNKYDDLYLYGIGLENNYDVDETVRRRRYDTWCNKKLVIVLSKQPRQDIVKNTESATYGKGPFFLLITADEWNHDADEWIGIYTTKKEAREAYDRAVAWYEEERKIRYYSNAQEVTLVEFIIEEDRFRAVDRCELD